MERNYTLGTRNYRSRLKMYTGWPAMIAMLDIFFLALWFFAQSSSYTRLSGIRVELPKAKAPGVEDIHQYVISIMPAEMYMGGEPRIYFRSRQVTLSQLPVVLADLPMRPAPRIAILADRKVPYDHVAKVLAVVGNMGLHCFLPVMPAESGPELRFEQ